MFNWKKLCFFIIIFSLASCNSEEQVSAPSQKLSPSDKNYLQEIYKATFACINYFVHPDSGLPYDVSDLRKETSISNIGLYMAAIAIAGETGLLDKNEAIARLNQTFVSLEKIEKWHGFPITWVDVSTCAQAFGPGFSYADHVGNLVSGLLVVSGIFPQEFKNRIDNFINSMDFKSTYDPQTGWLKGGYDLDKQDFAVKQSWGNWYYNLLASDTRHFSLLGIALGQIPEQHWQKLNRNEGPRGKIDNEIRSLIFPGKGTWPYYPPGMEGGGIFMQYLPGIFLKEQQLAIGVSAKNLAYCQIVLSKKNNIYPFWGISACESPDGQEYLGWGNLRKTVITPHAAVLAIEHYPREVIVNLQALEQHGVRPLFHDINNQPQDFGFTDSFDVPSKVVSQHYLILDQSMLFLSLANFLYNGIVRTSFNRHPLGEKINTTMVRLSENDRISSINEGIK